MAYTKFPFLNNLTPCRLPFPESVHPLPHRCHLRSTNLDLRSVTFHGDVILALVAKKAIHVHKWTNFIRLCYGSSPQVLVGLDTEWLPNTLPGEDHPIAIIQLSLAQHCLIYQFLHSDGFPESLHSFLDDPRYVFCGVGIRGDVKKLYEHHRLQVRRYADLNILRRMAIGKVHPKYMGLQKMARTILGKEINKQVEVTMSKWDSVDLDDDQIEYAAVDAYVSFQLGFRLSAILNNKYFCLPL